MARVAEFEQLMANVSAGSEEAIWQLAETYTPYILRAVRASLPTKVRSKLDSQDLAQTLWASILLKRTDLTRMKTPEQLIAFLARSARNRVVDVTRRYMGAQKYDVRREQTLDNGHTHPQSGRSAASESAFTTRDPSPSQFASLRERWNQILLTCSPREREILQLRLQGATFDDISRKLDINQATARRAIQRLIDRLAT
jgi:RNA polymerase sigma factor (sigma-70 family)